MRNRLVAMALGIGLAATLACVDGELEDHPPDQRESGLNLVTNLAEGSDVVGMRYTITPCAENAAGPIEPIIIAEKSLKELTLPGGIPKFENKPLTSDSYHQFADFFTLVEAGCYDVSVLPLRQLGIHGKESKASLDCPNEVFKKGVEVEKGKTTEILLISQCKGQKVGALDVVAALNFPPVVHVDTPIVFVCPPGEPETKGIICAEAFDPDGDPLEFVWKRLDEKPHEVSWVLDSTTDLNGKIRQCMEFTFPSITASYFFKVTVFDLFYGDIRAEDWINEKYYKDVDKEIQSRGKVKFPVHVICEEVGCPRSQGYWMTHKELWEDTHGDRQVCQGANELTYSQIMVPLGNHPAGERNFYQLAKQYIAAILNLEVEGSGTFPELEDALSAAEDLFLTYCGNKSGFSDPEGIKDFLDGYNNTICPEENYQ